jgi:tRNA dimethylallyltransferase
MRTPRRPELQYARARKFSPRRSQTPQACGLCVGDHWTAADCIPPSRSHLDSLLARDPLEYSLNVGAEHRDLAAPESLLVVILGPTASGKTALSLSLAAKFDGEIVNCDSVATYREFDIGTAKPTAAERARATHHLFDCVDPAQDVTAGEYARQARQVLEEIRSRRRLPIVVGGTGLYLRALLEGLFPGPQRSEELRERLRERVAERGSQHLHEILARLDREAAGKVHPNDAPKLIRAIEVCLASKSKMTELWRQGRDPLRGFQIVKLGLDPDRAALYERINRRAARMFEIGLVEETKALIGKYGATARPLMSLGYRQAMQLLRGEVTREQAVQAAQQAHRNYAKRQMTWFRREPDVTWLKGFGDALQVQRAAVDRVQTSWARIHTDER